MSLPPNLSSCIKVVYEPNGWIYSHLHIHKESSEYEACSFCFQHIRVQFRAAKVTPTKNGQFVTLWKRSEKGPIIPFDDNDPIDKFIIFVQRGENRGQFIFSKQIFAEKGVVSIDHIGGKRAIRVYPPWDNTTSAQAKQTQKWQLPFFIWMNPNSSDFNGIQNLLLDQP